MNIVEEIKLRVTMRDVLESYGFFPVRGRNSYCCMYHQDRRPSANIMQIADRFHCFSCGVTKDIFDFVQDQEKCDFKTATKIIDEKFNLGLVGSLGREERKKLMRQIRERERAKREKAWWQEYESLTLLDIIKKLRLYEECERQLRIQKGQYRGSWSADCGDVYFHVVKEIAWLEWLYAKLCGYQIGECEYDYCYPTDKRKLLELINKNEIVF